MCTYDYDVSQCVRFVMYEKPRTKKDELTACCELGHDRNAHRMRLTTTALWNMNGSETVRSWVGRR